MASKNSQAKLKTFHTSDFATIDSLENEIMEDLLFIALDTAGGGKSTAPNYLPQSLYTNDPIEVGVHLSNGKTSETNNFSNNLSSGPSIQLADNGL